MTLKLVSVEEGTSLVRLSTKGRITGDHYSPDKDPLATMLGPNVFRQKVLLSLEGTDFLDSSGVGWLVAMHRKFQAAGGMLVLYAIPPVVGNILKVLKMDQLLNVVRDEAAAVLKANGATA